MINDLGWDLMQHTLGRWLAAQGGERKLYILGNVRLSRAVNMGQDVCYGKKDVGRGRDKKKRGRMG